MLKGQTTEFLILSTHAVKAGETILLHAAAGGAGLILSQWAKHLGATVIGTVGSDEKAILAAAPVAPTQSTLDGPQRHSAE
jgi:NADPH2:quinone reductase